MIHILVSFTVYPDSGIDKYITINIFTSSFGNHYLKKGWRCCCIQFLYYRFFLLVAAVATLLHPFRLVFCRVGQTPHSISLYQSKVWTQLGFFFINGQGARSQLWSFKDASRVILSMINRLFVSFCIVPHCYDPLCVARKTNNSKHLGRNQKKDRAAKLHIQNQNHILSFKTKN